MFLSFRYRDPKVEHLSWCATKVYEHDGIYLALGGARDRNTDEVFRIASMTDDKTHIEIVIGSGTEPLEKLIKRGKNATTSRQLRVFMLEVYINHLRDNPELFIQNMKEIERAARRDGKEKAQRLFRKAIGVDKLTGWSGGGYL